MGDRHCIIDGPLRDAHLDALREATYVVVRQDLTRAEWGSFARAYGASSRPRIDVFIESLRAPTFLEHFGELPELRIESRKLKSLEGIEHVAPSLRRLHIGPAASKAVSLRPLAALQSLRYVWLDGHRKHLDAVQALAALETIELRGSTLPSLDFVASLPKLRTLALWGGGTSGATLEALTQAPALATFMLSRNRAVDDVSVVARLPHLETLFLDLLVNVGSLPSLAPCRHLRALRLDTMKGLHDLTPLAAAPALTELRLLNMPQLEVASFKPLLGHPTLARLSFEFGSAEKNEAVRAMFPKLADAQD